MLRVVQIGLGMVVLAVSMLVLSTHQDWKDAGQTASPTETTGIITFSGETPDFINLLKVSTEEEAEDESYVPVVGCLTEEECEPIKEPQA